jgi:type I restriction enzyme, S subunit
VTADVEWPSAWRSVPLWSLFHREKDVEHPEEEMLSVFRDYGVVRKASRSDNFNKTAENRNIYQLVDNGWLIVNRMKAWQGSLGVSSYRGIVSGHYICFKPHHFENSHFLDYLLRSPPYRSELARLSRGVRPSQIEIDNDWLRALPLHLPPPGIQRRIANFLDTETAQIDALTASKRQMIQLIQERLAGAIVERLSPLEPKRPLKRSWKVTDCKHRTPDYVASGYPVVSPGDVTPGRLDLARCHRFVDQADYDDLADITHRPKKGDIIYSRNASIGIAAYVETDVPFCMGQDVCLITSPNQDQRYLTHVLNSIGVSQLEKQKIGSTFSRVNIAQIVELDIPTPALSVQRALADEFDDQQRRHQHLIQSLQDQIVLLQESRQALITAAVTGEMEIPGVAA